MNKFLICYFFIGFLGLGKLIFVIKLLILGDYIIIFIDIICFKFYGNEII